MALAADFTSIYEQTFEVDYTQCTPDGVLKPTELCNLLQLTAAIHAEKGGISFSDMQQHHQAWVLSRMRIELARLPAWREEVSVRTWINSLENARSFRALEMYAAGQKIAGCHTFWASFNTQTRRPEPLQLAHDHFEKFPGLPPTHRPASRIMVPENIQKIAERTVRRSDLDMVAHVNNVKYLEWCLDEAHEDIRPMAIIEMNFMRELVLGDAVEIWHTETSDGDVFCVRRGKTDCFALRIQ